MRIAVVTDSTADLPSDATASPDLFVVNLSVAFGDDVHVAGVDLGADDFYARLQASDMLPVTSQPSPQAFDDVYAACAAQGYDHVLSVHCSSELSGTHDVASQRAPHAPIDVEVVDSRLVGGALGLAVLRALRVARETGDPALARAAVDRVREGVVGLLVVDTLVFLRRGGRLSGAQAAVGTALNVKPLLGVVDGRVEVVDRARTSRRAFDRAVELAVEGAAGSPVDVCVVHASAPGRASALEARLSQHVAIASEWRATIGPIVGTHVGPGAVGLAVVPAE